jgi:hypothetical protein
MKMWLVIGTIFVITRTLILATMTADTSRLVTSVFMVLVGIGLGCAQQMTTTIAQNTVDRTQLSMASGAVTCPAVWAAPWPSPPSARSSPVPPAATR